MRFEKGTFTLSLVAFVGSIVFFHAIGQPFGRTLLNLVLGWLGGFGNFLSATIVFLIIPFIQVVVLHYWRAKNKDRYEAYVKTYTENGHTLKEHLLEAWNEPYMRGECFVFAIFVVVYTIALIIYNFIFVTVAYDVSLLYTWQALLMLLYIPIFIILNMVSYVKMHRDWIEYHNDL